MSGDALREALRDLCESCEGLDLAIRTKLGGQPVPQRYGVPFGAMNDVNRYCAAARAALAAAGPAQDEWRTIESAPKMKTIMLFAITDTATGNWKMETGFWHSGYEAWRWGGHICPPYDAQPTHWRPLPAPPVQP